MLAVGLGIVAAKTVDGMLRRRARVFTGFEIARQDALDEVVHAASDIGPHILDRNPWPPEVAQHAAHAEIKVSHAVDQRPVKIKENGIDGQCLYCLVRVIHGAVIQNHLANPSTDNWARKAAITVS